MPGAPRPGRRGSSRRTLIRYAGLAQLVEHLTCNHEVVGSIPTPGSCSKHISFLGSTAQGPTQGPMSSVGPLAGA
jgi:hypothetical protein